MQTPEMVQELFKHHKIFCFISDEGGDEFGLFLRDGLSFKKRQLIPGDVVNFGFERDINKELVGGIKAELTVLGAGGKICQPKESKRMDIRELKIGQMVVHRRRNKTTNRYEITRAEVLGLRFSKDGRPIVRLRHTAGEGDAGFWEEKKDGAKWWPAEMVYESEEIYKKIRGNEINATIAKLQEEKASL